MHDPLYVGLGQTISDVDFGLTKGATIRGAVHVPADAVIEKLMINIRYADQANEPYRGSSQSVETNEPEDFAISGFPPGEQVIISATAAGWASETLGPLTIGPNGIEGVSLTLRKQAVGSIRGKVVYGAGAPVSGASVWVKGSSTGPSARTETGADGEFSFESVLPDVYELTVHKFGMSGPASRSTVTVAPGQTISDVVINLAGGLGTIAGRIVDDAGAPVAGAMVRPHGPGPSGPPATSDAGGAFTVQGVEEDQCDLTIQAKGYANSQLAGIATGTKDLKVVMQRTGSVEGRVIDGRTGQPITEFEVAAVVSTDPEYLAEPNLPYNRFVNESGAYRVDDIPPGTRAVLARAAGYFASPVIVDVRPGQSTSGIDIVINPGAVVRATVVNDSGQAVPDARLFLGELPYSLDTRGANRDLTTTADGTCTLDKLAPGANRIFVYHPDYAPAEFEVDVRAGSELSPTFALSRSATVEGVVTVEGQAASDAFVSLHYTEGTISNFDRLRPSARTDANGAYRIEGLMQGSALIDVQSRKGMLQRRLNIVEGQTTRVDFSLGGGTAIVSGTVQFPSGSFAGAEWGAALTVETADGTAQYHASIDEEGRFSFRNVVAGQGMLVVGARLDGDKRIGKTAALTIPPDGEVTHHFDFGQGATVQGMASINLDNPEIYVALVAGDVDMAALSNATYANTLELRMVGQTLLDRSGPFQFDAVDPGEYTVLIATDGLRHVSGTHVTVPEGESLVNVDLALP